jgi:hypothetical protein
MEQFWMRTKMSGFGLGKLFQRWQTWVLMVGLFGGFLAVLTLLSNGSTFWGLLMSPYLSGVDKFQTIGAIFVSGVGDWMMVAISGFQAVTLAIFIQVMIQQRRLELGTGGGSLITTILAGIGLGCPTCGTSLLIPFISIFVTSGVAVWATILSNIIFVAILVADLFIVRRLGYVYSQIALAPAIQTDS